MGAMDGLPQDTMFHGFALQSSQGGDRVSARSMTKKSSKTTSRDGSKYRMGESQMKTRLDLEQRYIEQWEEGRRMRKKP